jgi:hypothetical protein
MLKGVSRACQITHRSAVLNLATLRLLGKRANAYACFTAPPVTNPRKTDCRPLVSPFGTNKRDAAYDGIPYSLTPFVGVTPPVRMRKPQPTRVHAQLAQVA